MNLALGALIILLFLLPALFFRLGLAVPRVRSKKPAVPSTVQSQEEERKQHEAFSNDLIRTNFINILSKLNFSETLFFFSIIPILLHLVSLCLIGVFGSEINFSLLLNIFSSKHDAVEGYENAAFSGELISFLRYTLVEIVISFLLGWLIVSLVQGSKNILKLFVGENIWYQLFRGLMLPQEQRSRVDAIVIDILTSNKETSVIYTGLLVKFDLVPNTKELSYVTIRSAARRDLRHGTSKSLSEGTGQIVMHYINDNGPMINIPGKYFTVLGKEILNINVTYLEIVKEIKDGHEVKAFRVVD